jgi:spermidine synthase
MDNCQCRPARYDHRVTVRTEFGTAELVPDPGRPRGWTLLVDGVAQSYVDLDDPTYLEFEYVRRLASVVDAVAPPRVPLRVLHLGAGALTLPRYVQRTRPGSAQLVLERDAALVGYVLRELPLPAGAGVRIDIADARTGVAASTDGYDLVLSDVYQAARMPRSVASAEFAALVAERLRPGGLYAVNLADLPPLAFSRTQAATLRTAFGDVCLIAEPGMLRGRRYGNVILVAAAEPDGLPLPRLVAAANRDPFPNRVVHGAALDRFLAGAKPVADASAKDSPAPPPALLD